MQVSGGEAEMLADAPPEDWASRSGQYTDLNEPVIRPDKDGDGNPELIFPIIDPRAYVPTQAGTPNSKNVEGFWYNPGFAGVAAANNEVDINARLPMPVEWVYVLKNGMMGTVTGSGTELVFQPATSGSANSPTLENPIVGRIAFWTDDEACKININTSGEPTPWQTPMFYHDRDMEWAHFQPMSHEYQRYPGHPATVAMSSVLFPNQDLELYGKPVNGAQYKRALQIKERIYSVMPKLNSGGSKAGTVAYWLATDTNELGFGNLAKSVDLTASIKERLYASVDELMFSQRLGGNGKLRLFQDDPTAGSAGGAFTPIFQTPRELERARFFLTAHSRSPEVNMFGMPRVAIWPVADESLGADYRTGFDNLIAFCSKLGPGAQNSYFFRRVDSRSATTDINLPRNAQLLNMLQNILETKVMPGGATFASKYNQGDSTQILVEIFDYIRSTNLYDGFLAPTRQQMLGNGTQSGGDAPYRWETYDTPANRNRYNGYADAAFYLDKPDHKTYTADRISRWTGNRGIAGKERAERTLEYTFPGHGSVVPSEYQNGQFRGMGRFPTVTEVGFLFICAADGNPDKGSFRMAERGSDGSLTKRPWPGADAAVQELTANPRYPLFQGGRTAVKLDAMPVGQQGIGPGRAQTQADGNAMFLAGETKFWYSNFPPFPVPGSYGTDPTAPINDPRNPRNHPGFDSANWNAALPRSQPLVPGEKMVQCMLNLELCVPMVGYGPVHPEFTIVITGLQGIKLNGKPLFDFSGSGRVVWKTGRELYHASDDIGSNTAGGFIDGACMTVDRRVKIPMVGAATDANYDTSAATSGDPHRGLRNYDLVSRFFKVSGTQLSVDGAPLTIEIYAEHQITGRSPVQTCQIPSIGSGVQIPMPELVILSSDRRDILDNSTGARTVQREIHAPQWWALNHSGVLGRFVGQFPGAVTPTSGVVDNNDPGRGIALGRFAGWGSDRVGLGGVPRGQSTVFGYDANSGNQNSNLLNPVKPGPDVDREYVRTKLSDRLPEDGDERDMRGTDVMISLVPTHGDVRHLMGKKTVPASDWMPHPKITDMLKNTDQPNYFAHNISRGNANANPGYDRGTARLRLVPATQNGKNFTYDPSKVPDLPSTIASVSLAAKYGDFDNGPGSTRDGAWLNKPDEGNAGITWISQKGETRRVPTAYFQEEDRGSDTGESYMTPNRMIASPGMFGSLPSRIKGGEAWRTLLFRPSTVRVSSPSTLHPGAPAYAGGVNPADHFIMDLFWMPIVEPYAISETFSSAGKVNINYQMVPFAHIRRSTGIHAVLKGEIMAAIPNADAYYYLNRPRKLDGTNYDIETTRDGKYHFWQPWSDVEANAARYDANGRKLWYRKIETETANAGGLVNGTLAQFESRFKFQANAFTPAGAMGLFRTASQICEIHLIPRKEAGSPASNGGDASPAIPYNAMDMRNINDSGFWSQRQMTGDNTRERPYANVYGKITTQSNTFRIYYKAQVIQKARSAPVGAFDTTKDRVASEYRGTTLIERKLDPNDPRLPDYAVNPAAPPLDAFYRFRVLESKRFTP
jgi:uncharacterized protein (TIGR02600 family)